MNTTLRVRNITDKFIYISWGLLFLGVLNLPLPILNTSALAVRMNVAFAAIVLLIKFTKQSIGKLQFKLITIVYLLLTIQVIGLFGRITAYSITSLIITLLVIVYIIFAVDIDYSKVNKIVFKIPFYLIIFGSYISIFFNDAVIFDKYTIGDNTMGGMLVFLSIINIALSEINGKYQLKKWIRMDYLALASLIPLLMYTRARTSIATLVVILAIYYLLSKVKMNKRQAYLIFWFFIISVISIAIVYSYSTNFSFYSNLNRLSVQYFGKNIDSSRPMLWKASIEAIGGKWLFGLGTGTLPSDFIMFEASFHNQFLQLFMQNGVLGLSIFCFLLYTLWKPIGNNLNDPVVKICASAFLGILIYNSFETTLLQNKIALGLIQWQIIAIGVSRSIRINDHLKNLQIFKRG